jgi:hypothetical protein
MLVGDVTTHDTRTLGLLCLFFSLHFLFTIDLSFSVNVVFIRRFAFLLSQIQRSHMYVRSYNTQVTTRQRQTTATSANL